MGHQGKKPRIEGASPRHGTSEQLRNDNQRRPGIEASPRVPRTAGPRWIRLTKWNFARHGIDTRARAQGAPRVYSAIEIGDRSVPPIAPAHAAESLFLKQRTAPLWFVAIHSHMRLLFE